MTATATPPATAADLLRLLVDLGEVNPARVRMYPFPGTATEADLVRANEQRSGPLCELIDGTLVEKEMGVEESFLAAWLITRLNNFVFPRRLGAVLGADAMQRLAPGLVRLPDVSFITLAKWREWRRRRPAIGDSGPDLAVEILSRRNTRAEIERKRQEYFAAGALLVWEIHPRRQTVTVHTATGTVERLGLDDILDGGDLLPGFTLPVRELFDDPLNGEA